LGSKSEVLEKVEHTWSPLLQPEPKLSHHKIKQKHGVSDVSRDQVSSEGSPGPAMIDNEDVKKEKQSKEELEGTYVNAL